MDSGNRRWLDANDLDDLGDREQEERASHELLDQPTREAMNRVILENIVPHTYLPSSVEAGHVDLTHKTAAFVFSQAMECASRGDLRRVLAGFHSLTTDLGTEIGVAGFHSSLDRLLPDWYRPERPARLQMDGASDGEEGDPTAPEQGEDCEDFVFQRCVAIPGILHMVHNLDLDIDKALPDFSAWYDTMRHFSALLCEPFRRRSVYSACIQGTLFETTCKAAFERSVPKPYEKRWGFVLAFLRQALPMLEALRGCWVEVKYVLAAQSGAEAEANISEFSPQQMTTDLKDDFWFAYARMLLTLHNLSRDLSGWAESCPCHEHLRHSQPAPKASQLQAESGLRWVTTCPMAGMRAHQMAAGEFAGIISAHSKELMTTFIVEATAKAGHMTQEQWARLESNFQLGVASLSTILAIKTQHWFRLPWLLFGLSHGSDSVAERIARSGLGDIGRLESSPR